MGDSASPQRGVRLHSLDAFRGLTIGAMLIVNNPGSWSHVFPPLRHAAWHGCTPTDLIFPFFLFIVGVAMAFSSRLNPPSGSAGSAGQGRARTLVGVARRAGVLFALGLLLNFTSLFLKTPFDLTTLRIPGVLQRIAMCYLLAAVAMLFLRPRWQLGLGVLVLLGYWAVLTLLPAGVDPAERLAQGGNLVAHLDRVIMGSSHMYRGATPSPHDPEGLLSTLPALVTTLIGVWTGQFLKRSASPARAADALRLALAGVVLASLGFVWHLLPSPFGCPLNKELWTSSYVVFTAGCALCTLSACHFVCEVLPAATTSRWQDVGLRLLWPAKVMGLNAILAFVGSGLMARVLQLIRVPVGDGKVAALSSVIYQRVFDAPLTPTFPPEVGSVLYAVSVLAFWWVICYVLYRRRWFWKI